MNDCLRVTGYDKVSERLTIQHEVPAAVVSEARHLAEVGSDDDGLGIYPLDVAAALKLGLRMDRTLNVDLYDWFLEPR